MVLVQKDLVKLGPGKHPDDGKGGVTGLFLLVKPSGRRSWVLRLSVDGKRAERGLGSLMDVPLSIARRKAIEIRQRRDAGLPLDKAPRGSHTTVAGVYEEVLAHRRATWRNPRSEAQWRSSFTQHCGKLAKRDIGTITSKDILEVASPIWSQKTETANRVLNRLDITIRYARAKGLYLRPEDPIDLARASLPKIKRERGHMAAVDVEKAPEVFRRILELDSPSSWALVFAILTAGRSGEVRNLTADQLGLDNALWSVPAERMKTGKPHSVPLSKLAIKFAKKGLSLNREAVFPNRSGRALSNAALLECLKGITTGATVHGWRSTFMGWATKEGYSRELTEKALAHQEPNQVRRAYQRNNLLEERRPMMKAWERYLLSSK